MRIKSIQTRLLFTYVVLVLFSTCVTFIFFVPRIQSYLEGRAEDHLRNYSRVLASTISRSYGFTDGNLALVAEDLGESFGNLPGTRIRVYDPEGVVVADTEGGATLRTPSIPPEAREAVTGVQETWIENAADGRVLHVSTPLKAPGRVFGVADISMPLRDSETLETVRHIMLLALLASVIASWAVAWLLTQTIVRPLARIRDAANRIAEGELAQRVQVSAGDELGDLGVAINNMAAQLESRIGEIVSEKNKMNSLLETMIDGVVALDAMHRVSFLNRVAETLLEIQADEAIGEPLTRVFDYPGLQSMLFECVQNERLVTRELNREGLILKVFFLPFKDERRLHHGTMMVIRDITDLRRLEEARGQFFGAVSHELRTPLTIIKGFVVTLLDNTNVLADDELKRSLERIDKESDRLARLVEDILELSSLRSKKMSLELSPIDAEDHVQDTLETLASHAQRAGVGLIPDLARAHSRILADPDRFRQIVLNLVDNGIKYTPVGGEVRVISRRLENDWLLEIRDTGVGIPGEEIPFLFERFFRSRDKQKKKSIRGTGLGMAIVKELVDAHMAQVDVQSEVGKGTAIRLTFPLQLLPGHVPARVRSGMSAMGADGTPNVEITSRVEMAPPPTTAASMVALDDTMEEG